MIRFLFAFIAAFTPLQIMTDSTANALYNNMHTLSWLEIVKVIISFLLALLSRFVYAWIDDYFKRKKNKYKR
jgi:hypothetical protein